MKHLSTQEQISATELEIQILSDILAVGVFDPNVKFSDLCVQRAEAMARLNALRVRQGRVLQIAQAMDCEQAPPTKDQIKYGQSLESKAIAALQKPPPCGSKPLGVSGQGLDGNGG